MSLAASFFVLYIYVYITWHWWAASLSLPYWMFGLDHILSRCDWRCRGSGAAWQPAPMLCSKRRVRHMGLSGDYTAVALWFLLQRVFSLSKCEGSQSPYTGAAYAFCSERIKEKKGHFPLFQWLTICWTPGTTQRNITDRKCRDKVLTCDQGAWENSPGLWGLEPGYSHS